MIVNYKPALPILFMAMVSCQPKSSTTEVSDSTQSKVDTITRAQPIISETLPPEEPEILEPDIDSSQLTTQDFNVGVAATTGNKNENKTISKLESLIAKYEQQKYATIEITHVQDDPVVQGRISEHEIWYYNAKRQLCAHKNEYKSERTTAMSLYLFDDKSVTGAFTSSSFYDEGAGYDDNTVQVASMCPNCGVTVTNDDGDGYVVTTLDESGADKYSSDILKRYDDSVADFKTITSLAKEGERYYAIVLPNQDNQSDTIKYSVDPNLIKKYFKKVLVKD